MEEANYQTKIVICGSPHSGKSVFITNLYKILPQKYTFLIRACPDGEGVFSNNKNQNIIQLTKRKGEMSSEFVKEVKQQISKETAPIVLIDVGGLQSKENEEIFEDCDLAIILDKSQESINDWKDFCKEQKVGILAEIKSELGEDIKSSFHNSEDIIKGKIANLQRGENKAKDAVIMELAKKISNIASEKGLVEKGKELLSEDNVFNMREVADYLGMIKNDNIEWKVQKAKDMFYYSSGFAFVRDELKIFEARANWVAGLVCEAAKKQNIQDISLYDTRLNKYVETKKLKVEEEIEEQTIGNIKKYEILPGKINLYTAQNEDEEIIQFEIDPKSSIKEEDMDKIVLPPIDKDKKINISGRLPLWLFTSISKTYENDEKTVLQPGNGFIQYASSKSENLGKIERELPNINFEKFLKTVKEDVEIPQGGDER